MNPPGRYDPILHKIVLRPRKTCLRPQATKPIKSQLKLAAKPMKRCVQSYKLLSGRDVTWNKINLSSDIPNYPIQSPWCSENFAKTFSYNLCQMPAFCGATVIFSSLRDHWNFKSAWSFQFVHSFLCCAEAFQFDVSHYLPLLLLLVLLVSNPKSFLSRLMSKSFSPKFSFTSFVVSGFMFKSLIHFGLIFVYFVR